MKEIPKEYQDRCPEKENFDLQVYELGIILKEVFPGVERVHRTRQFSFAKTARPYKNKHNDFLSSSNL